MKAASGWLCVKSTHCCANAHTPSGTDPPEPDARDQTPRGSKPCAWIHSTGTHGLEQKISTGG